ncbi:ankyrin repeat and LEM domain-containing protein 1-like isoform X2 [Bacillus rossius redtenbacheri]|uniref:ankyrin repeat and LEM domain-containing protein 1-like isoform X2 n=1 Tax=Bacillus rossius redtenbacheri TaxID=93214 RepID=UPI002FDD1C6B
MDSTKEVTSGLECFLKKGASPNLILPEYGVAPFHIAVAIGKESYGFHAAKLFLQYGGDPNVRSVEGLTPVHVAAVWGQVATLYLLLVNGGDPRLTDEEGRDAFQHARLKRQVTALRLLESFQGQGVSASNPGKAILPSENLSSGHVTDPAVELQAPETRSAGTQTQYFRPSFAPVCSENKQQPFTNKSHIEENIISLHSHGEFVNTSIISVNKVSNNKSNEHKDFLSELKHVLACRGDTGSVKIPGRCDKGGGNESIKENFNTCDTVLHSDSSSMNDADVLPSVPTEGNRSTSSDLVLEELKSFDKNCSLVHHFEDKCSVLPTRGKTDVDLQEAGSEKTCENKTKDGSVEGAAYLSCEDMFGSLLTEDESAVRNSVEHHRRRVPTVQVSDLMTSDEGGSMSGPRTCSQPPVVDTAEPEPSPRECSSVSVDSRNSLVPLCEEYRYTDDEEGVVLLEKVFLVERDSLQLLTEDKHSSSALQEERDDAVSSTAASFPISLDYDSDTLRKDLRKLGQNIGPITATTKRVYLKRLYALHKHLSLPPPTGNIVREYSSVLEKALNNIETVNSYAALEQAVSQQFSSPDRTCRWRKGVLKTSFTYLLLDPRVSRNLPRRGETLSRQEQWSAFLSAVFYVGKGTRARPYAHLYEAVAAWKKPRPHVNSKVRLILDVWRQDLGVVCLHIFQTVIPAEAFTREAAMIDAIGLRNLRNCKRGEYYGVASTWTKTQQQQLGSYLLYRALQMFLIEGERQVRPDEI